MDQKNLIIAIALSVAILVGFQWLSPRPHPVVADAPIANTSAPPATPAPPAGSPAAQAPAAVSQAAVPRDVPRLQIDAPRVRGSISLLGARIDDLVLRDYRETIDPGAKLVRLLEPRADPQPYFVQFGWTAAEGDRTALPGDDTVWTASGPLTTIHPSTLSWDNGHGQVFEIELSVDDHYMFSVQQRVRNNGPAPVTLYPWARIRRDYTPVTAGYYILHEGMLGILGGSLKETKYAAAKTEGEKNNGVALTSAGAGGWAGFTDKYWLTALIPDQASKQTASFRHLALPGDAYQVDFLAEEPQTVAPGGTASQASRMFAGAKEVHLLDRYETQGGIPKFSLRRGLGLVLLHHQAVLLCDRLAEHLPGQFRPRHSGVHRLREGAVLPAGEQILSLDEQDEAAWRRR